MLDEVHILTLLLSGGVNVSENITLTVDSDLNGASPQFILTCISTGGPATTVTWTRDPGLVMGDEMSVLDTTTTAQYTHILTVTGRLEGLYTCTVSNDKPSEAMAYLTVEGTFSGYRMLMVFPPLYRRRYLHSNM